MGCEWLCYLAGLVFRVYLYVDCTVSRVSVGGAGCVGFVYKIVEITAVRSDNGGGQVLGLLCVEWNGAGSNLALHFDSLFPCQFVAVCMCIIKLYTYPLGLAGMM